MQKKLLLNRIRELSHPLQPQKVGHRVHLDGIDNIKCVTFDFYGTIFISSAESIDLNTNHEEDNNHLFKKAIKACGLTIEKKEAGEKGYKKYMQNFKNYADNKKKQGITYPEPDVRNILYDVLIQLKSKGIIKGEVTREAAALCVLELELRTNAVWPMPDLYSQLKSLKKSGYRLGIISNSQFYSPISFEALVGTNIAGAGFTEKLLKWSYRHGVKKPSLDIYRLFIDELPAYNLKAEEVLYVGNDLFKDVIPAKKLGMKTALFVGDRRSIRHKKSDLIRKQMPDIIIDELSQIEECVT